MYFNICFNNIKMSKLNELNNNPERQLIIITLHYKPLIMGDNINICKKIVSSDELAGIMIMTYIINKKIVIITENGGSIDMEDISNLSQIRNVRNYSYNAIFNDKLVGFDSLEFINGAKIISLLLGINPNTIITSIKFNGNIIDLIFDRYIYKLEILNFTTSPDGISLNITQLRRVHIDFIKNLYECLCNCFLETKDFGIIIPANLYFISTKSSQHDIISMVITCKNLPSHLIKYNQLHPHYIFDVCTSINYRKQGLCKSLMIGALNDLISKGIKSFILEVKETNTSAYSLYSSLGFIKIDSNSIYDILYLSFN